MERLGTQWASNALPVLTRAPRTLQTLLAMNTVGQGGEGTGQTGGRKGWTWSLAHAAGLTRFLWRNGKELRTNPGCHCPLSAQDSSHCGPAGGARPDPTHWAGGASAWPSLPGSLCWLWLRETGTGAGAVPQGAAAMSSSDSSAAAGAPRGPGSVVPSRIEGTSTALWGGDVPSPTDTETLVFELKNKR